VSSDPGGNVLTDHAIQDLTGDRGGRVVSCIQKEANNTNPAK